MSCKTRRQPLMYVPKGITQARREYFLTNQYPILKQVTSDMGASSPERTFEYYEDVKVFQKMLYHLLSLPQMNGIRLYFATYSDEGSKDVPAGCAHLLTLIYVPTKPDGGYENSDIKDNYYVIQPRRDFFNIGVFTAKQWVSNFQDNKLILLPNEDTKSLIFDREQLEDLAGEIGCQLTNTNKIIKGIKANFIAASGEDYENQLSVDFVFTDNGNNNIDIEDTDDWDDRPEKQKRDSLGNKNLDTGNPCPPNNCGGATLPRPQNP